MSVSVSGRASKFEFKVKQTWRFVFLLPKNGCLIILASCTTSVLCNLFKELFLYRLLQTLSPLALLEVPFVLESGCKGMTFRRNTKTLRKKNLIFGDILTVIYKLKSICERTHYIIYRVIATNEVKKTDYFLSLLLWFPWDMHQKHSPSRLYRTPTSIHNNPFRRNPLDIIGQDASPTALPFPFRSNCHPDFIDALPKRSALERVFLQNHYLNKSQASGNSSPERSASESSLNAWPRLCLTTRRWRMAAASTSSASSRSANAFRTFFGWLLNKLQRASKGFTTGLFTVIVSMSLLFSSNFRTSASCLQHTQRFAEHQFFLQN